MIAFIIIALLASFGNALPGNTHGKKVLQSKAVLNEALLEEVRFFADSKRVKQLLDMGADVNAQSDAEWEGPIGETPLLALVRNGRNGSAETIKMLLERGANPNSRDSSGLTPLMIAIGEKNIEAVKILSHWRGLDLNQFDADGETALIYACRKDADLKIIQALVEGGANVNLKSVNSGRTALMLAAKNKNVPVIEYLLANGADKSIKDDHGKTAGSQNNIPNRIRKLLESAK